jgi:hypothetical protein
LFCYTFASVDSKGGWRGTIPATIDLLFRTSECAEGLAEGEADYFTKMNVPES